MDTTRPNPTGQRASMLPTALIGAAFLLVA